MDFLKKRIEFYRLRTFSEKMNVTFDFIRENWKVLLKYSFYLITPICLVQSFTTNATFRIYLDAFSRSIGRPLELSGTVGEFLVNYGAMFLCLVGGSAIMSGMIYALMQTYATRDNRLLDLRLSDFKEALIRNVRRALILLLFFIFAGIVLVFVMAFLAVAVSDYSFFVAIPISLFLLFCMIPLMMVVPVFIFERDISFFEAFGKAWRLGISTFWGLVGLMIVLYFIASVLQTVMMMPWYLTILFGSLFSISSNPEVIQSATFKFVAYLLGLIQSYGMYLSMIISMVGLAFQYFHAREKVEGITIDSNITHFEELS
jgi:hypothetical protein